MIVVPLLEIVLFFVNINIAIHNFCQRILPIIILFQKEIRFSVEENRKFFTGAGICIGAELTFSLMEAG